MQHECLSWSDRIVLIFGETLSRKSTHRLPSRGIVWVRACPSPPGAKVDRADTNGDTALNSALRLHLSTSHRMDYRYYLDTI